MVILNVYVYLLYTPLTISLVLNKSVPWLFLLTPLHTPLNPLRQ